MIRTLYCRRCAQPRTMDTTKRHVAKGAAMTCLRCGHCVFTTELATVDVAIALPQGGWLVTRYDRTFLRSLRIDAESVEARN